MKNLTDPRYEDYRERFGFEKEACPTKGGLCHFLIALASHSDSAGDTVRIELEGVPAVQVAVQYPNQLLAGAVHLICEANLLSLEAWTQALICPDGMLHDAASRLPPRDAEARFVYYSGSNRPRNSPNRPQDESKTKKRCGRKCPGCFSLAPRLFCFISGG